jgi:hypothetical protein
MHRGMRRAAARPGQAPGPWPIFCPEPDVNGPGRMVWVAGLHRPAGDALSLSSMKYLKAVV